MQQRSQFWVAAFALAAGCQARQQPALAPEVAELGSSYAAKVAASALFVSGRTLDSVRNEELQPDTPLTAAIAPLLQFEVDAQQHTVTARIGSASATAAFVPAFGCTLLHGVDLATLRARVPAPHAGTTEPDPATIDWPLGECLPATPLPAAVDGKALQAAVDAAFVEPKDKPKVRTRAVVVVWHGRLLAERYAEGYDAAMPLPGWSMTKTMVNALLGIRISEGKLDPGAELPVPEWRAQPDDPRRALRLEQLLRMHSGLHWNENYGDPKAEVLRMLFFATDYGGVAATQPLQHPPDSTFE